MLETEYLVDRGVIVLMMFTLEEIVDLEMAADHLDSNNLSQQSKTPYSDLTQVLKSRQLDRTKNLYTVFLD